MQSNGTIVCNVLSGNNIINLDGMTNPGGNTFINVSPQWNFVGNGTTSLNSLMNVGDVITVSFNQLVNNPASAGNLTWRYANGLLSNPLDVSIDGVSLSPTGTPFQSNYPSNICYPSPSAIGNTTFSSTGTGTYLYITNIFTITKIDSTPTWFVTVQSSK